MIKAMIAVALPAAPAAEPPTKATKDCVDPQLLAQTMLGVVPDLLKQAAAKCQPMLPAQSFLATRSAAMADRIKREAGDTTVALGALVKAMTGIDMPTDFKAEALAPLITAPITRDMEKLDAGGCAGLDRLLAAVEPLPAANLTQLITGFLILGGKDKNDLKLCPPA